MPRQPRSSSPRLLILALLFVAVFAGVRIAWRAWAPAETTPATTAPAAPVTAPADATPAAPAPTVPPPSTAAADAAEAGAATSRYDLTADEARGGHTIARHVGKSDAALLDRLRRERGISAASTYSDLATAERVVAATIAQHRTKVDIWLKRQGHRPNLALDYEGRAGESIGRSVRRGSTEALPCVDAVVVLRWDQKRSFYVLTSYPEASR